MHKVCYLCVRAPCLLTFSLQSTINIAHFLTELLHSLSFPCLCWEIVLFCLNCSKLLVLNIKVFVEWVQIYRGSSSLSLCHLSVSCSSPVSYHFCAVSEPFSCLNIFFLFFDSHHAVAFYLMLSLQLEEEEWKDHCSVYSKEKYYLCESI